MINGAGILITGGTGSFGRAFVERIVRDYKPSRLVIFSRDEMKQYEMAHVFNDVDYPFIRYFIGDVRDVERLTMAMRGIDYVIHCAALKHVTVAEYNPFECINTNVIGAENVVRAAMSCKVKKVLALSTDKAVNPINLYGASKLAADKIFIAANALSADIGSRFSVVRYGNVSNSRGSVAPMFCRLISEGAKSLPITDPRMTRFWITLKHGVDFVLSSLEMMCRGEIFVPKIPSIHITDLARCMAPDLPHKIVGIRPGEKLHESLITEDDARNTLEFDDRYVILPFRHVSISERFKRIGGVPVDESFQYVSNANSRWLGPEEIKGTLEDCR